MISAIVGHFDCKHLCLVKKNVPIAIILPSRWQVGAESLGIEGPQKLIRVRFFKIAQKVANRLGFLW